MLIISGVIIATTMDSDGIIADAEEATEQWNNRITAQDQAIQNVLAKRNEILGGTTTPTTPVEPPAEATPIVTLSATTGEIEEEGTLVLTASLNITATQNIVWTSSDDTIATVLGSGTNNRTGTITGIKAGGPVTITATYGDKTATCNVTVKEKPPQLISFTIEGKTYYSPEGWDWETWCASPEYNVDNFYNNGSFIWRNSSENNANNRLSSDQNGDGVFGTVNAFDIVRNGRSV